MPKLLAIFALVTSVVMAEPGITTKDVRPKTKCC